MVDPANVVSKLAAIHNVLGVSWNNAEAALSDLLREADPAVGALAAEYADKAKYLNLQLIADAVKSKNRLIHDLESDQSTRSVWPPLPSSGVK